MTDISSNVRISRSLQLMIRCVRDLSPEVHGVWPLDHEVTGNVGSVSFNRASPILTMQYAAVYSMYFCISL